MLSYRQIRFAFEGVRSVTTKMFLKKMFVRRYVIIIILIFLLQTPLLNIQQARRKPN